MAIKAPATMPAPKVPFPATAAPNPVPVEQQNRPSLHPAVQEHVVAWNETQKRLDNALLENQQLRNDLEVERRHRTELEHQLDKAHTDRDFFMRYSVEVQTHLEHIASSAIAARNRALEVARVDQGPHPDVDPLDPIEQNLAKIAQTFGAGKPNGSQGGLHG